MLEKLANPLGLGRHKITQTTHGEIAAHPNDLSQQQAIDCVPEDANADPVYIYAVAEGTIVGYTTASGGYITLDIGMPFYVLYVHVVCDLPIGTKVYKGQKIGRVLKGKDWHLHLGFKNKDKTPPTDNPMEYWEQNDRWYATHPDIIKLWCYPNGNVKWSLFKNKFIGVDDQMDEPNVKVGTIFKVESSILRFRKNYGLDGEEIRRFIQDEEITVVSLSTPIDDGYYWINVKDKDGVVGWTAYTDEWLTDMTPEEPDTCEAVLIKLDELSAQVEALSAQIEECKAGNEININLQAQISLYIQLVGVLNEEIKKQKDLNLAMQKESEKNGSSAIAEKLLGLLTGLRDKLPSQVGKSK